jgi:hypothetical protein
MTPFRLMILHFSHIGLTDARTFIRAPVSPALWPGPAMAAGVDDPGHL